MRLSSKIVGTALIVASTALAGCNCCDSGHRTASNQNPKPNQALASSQQPGARTNWNNQAGTSNQGQVMQAGGSGQPGNGVQTAGFNTTPPAYSGRPMSVAGGDMNPRTNPPAIPVTTTPTTAGTTPVSSAGAFGTPLTTPGAFGTQPTPPVNFSTRTTTSSGAYGAQPAAAAGAYGSSPGYGPGSMASPASTSPGSDALGTRRMDGAGTSGSAMSSPLAPLAPLSPSN